jgi:predicted alpha/beta-fold hydrolase
VATTAHRLDTPDGDWVMVHATAHRPGAPAVLLLHGLEGSARSAYIQAMLGALAARGWNGAALEFRGCSGALNTARRLYHSGETTDPRLALNWWRTRHPGTAVFLVGFSLGANIAARLLAEGPGPLAGAVLLAPPFDLAASATAVDHALGGLYRHWFLAPLRRKALAKERQFPGCLDADRTSRARTLWEFDDAATAPLHGFASAADYYARCACGPVLHQIRTPTLVITAEDDPMHPADRIPRDTIAATPCIEAVITRHGGHLGYMGPRRGTSWAEALAIEWMARRDGIAPPAGAGH